MREPPQLRCRHTDARLGVLGREQGGGLAELAGAAGAVGEEVLVGATVLEDHVEHREQEPGVRVGSHGQVLELTRGLRGPRVDNHDPAAARFDVEQLLTHARALSTEPWETSGLAPTSQEPSAAGRGSASSGVP